LNLHSIFLFSQDSLFYLLSVIIVPHTKIRTQTLLHGINRKTGFGASTGSTDPEIPTQSVAKAVEVLINPLGIMCVKLNMFSMWL
jgi:hypothetical protein